MNTAAALFSRILAILMGFFTRVVFTHTLSESYVGINGLFTDIIHVLSLTELGVETAICYALYRPAAEGDIEKQQILLRLFRNFYRMTALCVAVLGLAIIPFLDVLMKDRPDVEHILLIYLLYLANSVLSYLLVYKRTIISVHQMNYIVLFYQTAFLLVQDILQIIILVTTGNFILFLLMYIVCTLLCNLCLSKKADRMYPFLRQKNKKKLPKEERNAILKNIRAMLMHKVGGVVVNDTDNLLISAFVGVIDVGIYSNYFLIIGSVRQVIDQIFSGITASVGNLGVTEDTEKVKNVFETAFFIGQWLYGVAAICLFELLNPFIRFAFGENYLFPLPIVGILCVNFFTNGTRKAVLTFRDSMGLFWYDRYKAIAEAVINLVVSVLLVQKYGTFGVFAGTLFSTLTTSLWIEPYVLYHHKLKCPVGAFYVQYACELLVMGFIWIGTDLLCGQLAGEGIGAFFIRLLLCIIVPNVLLVLCYHRKKEFLVVKGMVWKMKKEICKGKRRR